MLYMLHYLDDFVFDFLLDPVNLGVFAVNLGVPFDFGACAINLGISFDFGMLAANVTGLRSLFGLGSLPGVAAGADFSVFNAGFSGFSTFVAVTGSFRATTGLSEQDERTTFAMPTTKKTGSRKKKKMLATKSQVALLGTTSWLLQGQKKLKWSKHFCFVASL